MPFLLHRCTKSHQDFGESHAFAVLHRELRFKFGSVGCSGEWSSGAVECLPFTTSPRAAGWDTCVLQVST